MRAVPLPMLCLSLLLLYIDFSFARGRSGGGSGRSVKVSSPSISHTGVKSSHGSTSKGGSTKQSGAVSPVQPVRLKYPDVRRSGRRTGYSGGYINQNPNNTILSPGYGGSFGYGGYAVGAGSPYSQSVQEKGMSPSYKSRRFGRRAAMAAAGGALAGMALGYGLGRFPRPHFNFHNPQEEYYYNHYMYRKYGVKSTDTDDYSRDYRYTQLPMSYDSYMSSCMMRTDVLSVGNQRPEGDARVVTSRRDGTKMTIKSKDEDTVSIVEIGYPALIEQVKSRRCLELYLVYSEKYLERATGGAQRLEKSLQGLLVTGTLMMLLSNIPVLPH